MKSNRLSGVGGIVLLAAFAMGTSAQASPLSGVSLSTDGSLSMADTLGTTTNGVASFTVSEPSFDDCDDTCIEPAAADALTSAGPLTPWTSYALSAAPEPATFVLVGLTLAVLPLIRKKRS
jgi:hypothetical protein